MLSFFFLSCLIGFTSAFPDPSDKDAKNEKSYGPNTRSSRMLTMKMSLPSLPSVDNVCLTIDCMDCNRFHKYLMCTVCCEERVYYEPVTLITAVQQETGSHLIASTNKVFLSSLQWLGLKPVYQNDDRGMRKEPKEEVLSLINNFNWANKRQLVKSKELDLNDGNICGHYIREKAQGRIVGGKAVKTPGRYPWQLSLATGYYGFFYQHRCGAALISESWVLTAAHCVQNMDIMSTYVIAGFLAVNQRDTAQIRKIEQAFIHPDFIADLYEQDIALLRLREPMDYTSLVLPVCLPTYKKDHHGKTSTLTGWGREWDDGPLSNQLHQVDLPVISNEECMSWYANSGSRQFIPESTFLCAGYEEGLKDACSGDSGGPLVAYREDNRAEVIGVVSWGIGCGVRGRPGVYTRITEFIPWINQTCSNYEASHRP